MIPRVIGKGNTASYYIAVDTLVICSGPFHILSDNTCIVLQSPLPVPRGPQNAYGYPTCYLTLGTQYTLQTIGTNPFQRLPISPITNHLKPSLSHSISHQKDVHHNPHLAQPASHRPERIRPPDDEHGRHESRHLHRHRPLRKQVLREPRRRTTAAHALGRL